jgi:hypothetical protein
MRLIRLTTRSDEPVHLDAAHITSIGPGAVPEVAAFVSREDGRVLGVKEAPERVRALLDPLDRGGHAAGVAVR